MANVKISDLTAAASASATQQFEVNESGTSKRVTGSQVAAYALSTMDSGDVSGAGGALTANNLSDLADAATARTNLGLGSIATQDSTSVNIDGDLTVDTDTLYVDSTNNRVGVGTTSPSQQLHLSGSTPIIRLTDTDTNAYGEISSSSSDGNLMFYADQGNTQADTTMRFYVDATERMRLDDSGVLVGGSNIPDIFPANNTSGYGVSLLANPNQKGRISVLGDDDCGLNVGRHTGTGNVAQWYYSGSIVGSVSVTASATAYNTSSDYRLKEDVQPMVGATDRVLALKPVNFAWKADGSRVDGFIAHEAQEIVPEAVTGAKDAVDADGNPDYQGIDQSKLVPLLTAALQDALTKIEALEARMAILEGGAA